MNRMKWFAAMLALACASGVQASDVARENGTLPVAFTSGQTKIVGVPFVRPPVLKGDIVAVGSSSIVTVGGLTAGEYNDAAGDNKYELEITSGRHIGLVLPVLSNSTSTVYLNGTLPPNVQQDTAFHVRKSWTPGSLFGTNNAEVTAKGLKTGAAAPAATQIKFYDPASNSFPLQLFFHNTANQWRRTAAPTTSTNIFDVRIGPKNAFVATSTGGAITMRLAGEYRKTRSLSYFQGGNARELMGNPNIFDVTLISSGLRNVFGESSTSNSVDQGAIQADADEVQKYFGSNNTLTNFYFRTASGQWHRSTTVTGDRGNEPIAAGEGVLFKRQPAGKAFIAIDPQFQD